MASPSVVPPTKKFRFKAGCVFLTYSQCPLSKEMTAVKFLGDLKWPSPDFKAQMRIAIARENHQDGNHHLHVLVEFPNVMSTSDPRFFDLCHEGVVYHPNIQAPRSKAAVADYITKDDPKPLLMNWDMVVWHQLLEAGRKSSKRRSRDPKSASSSEPGKKPPKTGDVVADLALNGKSIREMIEERPELRGYLLLHCRAVQHFQNVVGNLDLPKPKFGQLWVPTTFYAGEYPSSRRCFKVQPDRPHRTKGLWLHGPTSIGKTTMIHRMTDLGMIPYWFPYNNDHAQYQDGRYSFIVMDEFVGGVPLNQLNALLDGRPLQLNTKGGSVIKKDQLLVIIISNKEPRLCYPNTDPLVLDALMARFHIHHWPHAPERDCRIVIDNEPNSHLAEVETEPEESDAEEPEAGSQGPSQAPALSEVPVMEQKSEPAKTDADDGGNTTSSEDLFRMVKDYEPEEQDRSTEESDESSDESEAAFTLVKMRKKRCRFIDDEASGTDAE